MTSFRRILLTFFAALLAASLAAPAFAANPHEDPDKAQPAYSAVTLFRYYSDTIDSILAGDAATVTVRLDKMVYANLPPSIGKATDDFVDASMGCVSALPAIDRDVADLRVLLRQSRLEEATPLVNKLTDELSQAYSYVHNMEDSTNITGAYFGVFNEPPTSDIRLAYEGTLQKINQIRSRLDVIRDLLARLLASTSHALTPTDLTLSVQPGSVFVGDTVEVSGTLSASGQPLAGRDVNILFNSGVRGTVTTGAGGTFSASLTVPYWYNPRIRVEALYYPKDTDDGVYLASLSPPVTLNVLYYQASFSVSFLGTAYRGRSVTLKTAIAYSPDAEMVQRDLEIYLDNVFLAEVSATDALTWKIDIPADARVGRHTVTVTASAIGRYAPALTDAVLDITTAGLTLGMKLPRVIFVPGELDLTGAVASAVGPAQNAHVKVAAGSYTHEFRTAQDGSFQQRMKLRFQFGLIGSAYMDIAVYPSEPWNRPLTISQSILVVNTIVCGAFVLLMLAAGVLLPIKLKLQPARSRRRRLAQPAAASPPAVAPQYTDMTAPGAAETAGTGSEPRARVFSWYALVLRLVQRFAKVVFKPQHTLREFVAETRKTLGPLADYLMEFTRLVERLLYSRAPATDADAQAGEQLGRRVQDGLGKVNQ